MLEIIAKITVPLTFLAAVFAILDSESFNKVVGFIWRMLGHLFMAIINGIAFVSVIISQATGLPIWLTCLSMPVLVFVFFAIYTMISQ